MFEHGYGIFYQLFQNSMVKKDVIWELFGLLVFIVQINHGRIDCMTVKFITVELDLFRTFFTLGSSKSWIAKDMQHF